MSKIKDILESLTIDEQQKIQEAFEQGEPYFIAINNPYYIDLDPITIIPPKQYIGVNVENIPFLVEEEKIGEWSLGRINDS